MILLVVWSGFKSCAVFTISFYLITLVTPLGNNDLCKRKLFVYTGESWERFLGRRRLLACFLLKRENEEQKSKKIVLENVYFAPGK